MGIWGARTPHTLCSHRKRLWTPLDGGGEGKDAKMLTLVLLAMQLVCRCCFLLKLRFRLGNSIRDSRPVSRFCCGKSAAGNVRVVLCTRCHASACVAAITHVETHIFTCKRENARKAGIVCRGAWSGLAWVCIHRSDLKTWQLWAATRPAILRHKLDVKRR